jgi:hypothetical protein
MELVLLLQQTTRSKSTSRSIQLLPPTATTTAPTTVATVGRNLVRIRDTVEEEDDVRCDHLDGTEPPTTSQITTPSPTTKAITAAAAPPPPSPTAAATTTTTTATTTATTTTTKLAEALDAMDNIGLAWEQMYDYDRALA